MFTIDQAATTYIYIEVVIPIIILVSITISIILKSYKTKWKIKKINEKHNAVERNNSIFWDTYYCTKCNQFLYEQSTDMNTLFSKTHYIFYKIHKCIKD